MDGTPISMASTQRLVDEDLGAPAAPRDRQGVTAKAGFRADAAPQDGTAIPTQPSPHECADGP